MNDATPPAYSLEILAEITGVATQTIVQYQEHGLIRPQFDDETIRALRRIEHLRETCEMNLHGLKLLTHGILFDRLVGLAADEVGILVGFEVAEAQDHILRIKRRRKHGDALARRSTKNCGLSV
jgi:DNA-binding transcriptional MerR regulator